MIRLFHNRCKCGKTGTAYDRLYTEYIDICPCPYCRSILVRNLEFDSRDSDSDSGDSDKADTICLGLFIWPETIDVLRFMLSLEWAHEFYNDHIFKYAAHEIYGYEPETTVPKLSIFATQTYILLKDKRSDVLISEDVSDLIEQVQDTRDLTGILIRKGPEAVSLAIKFAVESGICRVRRYATRLVYSWNYDLVYQYTDLFHADKFMNMHLYWQHAYDIPEMLGL